MAREMRMVLTVAGCGFIGIIIAAIFKVLHDKGTVIDEFITGSITLPELMALVIILFLLVGVILGAITK